MVPPVESWRMGLIVRRLAEGCTFHQAARAAGVDRVTVWRWMRTDRAFAEEVVAARRIGEVERVFRLWLHHPRRGFAPACGPGSRRTATVCLRAGRSLTVGKYSAGRSGTRGGFPACRSIPPLASTTGITTPNATGRTDGNAYRPEPAPTRRLIRLGPSHMNKKALI